MLYRIQRKNFKKYILICHNIYDDVTNCEAQGVPEKHNNLNMLKIKHDFFLLTTNSLIKLNGHIMAQK